MDEAVASVSLSSRARERASETLHTRPPLGEPLPTDVFATSLGSFAGYRCYPTFSAPWFWRRTAIFAPIVGTVGLVQSLIVALLLRDERLGFLCAGVAVPVWLVIVTAGPAFATLVRHARLRLQVERVALVAAVLLGLAASCVGQYLAGVFSRTMIAPRYTAYLAGPTAKPFRDPDPVVAGVIWTAQAVFFFCLGGGFALRTYFREERSWHDAEHARELALLRREKNEVDLRLTVLQAQVEPHFLYNTLASIHSLIRTDPVRAEATLEALVAHLRATMPRLRAELGSTDSTLEQQVEICTSYLALMQVRMGRRLRFTAEVPAHLNRHPFPPLMLISLVENAIKHGIEPCPPGGNVVVSAAVEDHADGRRLAVSVVDDGAGLRAEIGGGMGLRNVREQLAARFGSRGSLLIRGRSVGGVTATIRVPYATEKTA